MKLKKLALMLCAVLTVAFCISAYAQEEENTLSKEAQFLHMLGIYSPPGYGEEINSQSVTRAEFVSALMHMAYRDMLEGEVNGENFSDVGDDNTYYYEILAAKNIGLVSGTEYNRFSPNEKMKTDHAFALIKKVLGYEESDDAILLAKGIMSGVDTSDEYMSVNDLIMLLYNALDIDMMSYTGDGEYKVVKDETILSLKLDVYDTTGIVDANKYTALYAPFGTGEENVIMVNGIKYNCGNYDMSGLLGCSIKLYYRVFEEDEPEIIFYEEKKCEHIELDSDDITGFENNTYSVYYKETAKKKNYKIETDAAIIHNGVAADDLTYIKPEYGKVKLIDNDMDGRYEVVDIVSYETYFVDGIHAGDYLVYSNGNILEFDEDTLVYNEGQASQFEVIAPKSVILVAESSNAKGEILRKIETSTNKAEGKPTSVEEDEIVIDGVSYKINPELMGGISEYTEGVYYIDAKGRIAFFTAKIISGERYGLLMFAANDIEESVVRIINDASESVRYKLSDKIKLDSQRMEKEDVCNILSSRVELVRYKLNSDNEIVSIDTADEGGELEKIKYNGNATVFMYRARSKSFGEYRNARGYENGTSIYFVDANTKVFYKGSDKRDEKNFRAGSFAEFTDNAEYVLEGYDMNENGICGAVVINTDSGSEYIYRYNYFLYVNKVVKTVSEEDEIIYIVKGIFNGAEAEYKILPEDFPDAEKIKPGDIFQFTSDSKGVLTAIRYVYSRSGSIPTGFKESEVSVSEAAGLKGSIGDTALIVMGKSVNRYNNVLEVEYMKDGAPVRGLFDISAGTYIEYEDSKYTVNTSRSIPAVCSNGQLIFIHVRSGGTFEIVYIKE